MAATKILEYFTYSCRKCFMRLFQFNNNICLFKRRCQIIDENLIQQNQVSKSTNTHKINFFLEVGTHKKIAV